MLYNKSSMFYFIFNKTMKYLQTHNYYNDLYDKLTIENCRQWEKSALKNFENEKDKQFKIRAFDIMLYFIKGEHYKNKAETIKEWMDRDRRRDHKLDSISNPSLKCKFCEQEMELVHKDISTKDHKFEIVVFHFRCKECKVGRSVDEAGLITDSIPWKCPKCTRRLNHQNIKNGTIIATIDDCPFCGYHDEFSMDLKEEKEEESKEERKQFNIDRDRFCLSEKDGLNYLEGSKNLNKFVEFVKNCEKNK